MGCGQLSEFISERIDEAGRSVGVVNSTASDEWKRRLAQQ
jgi:hypothetical protein